MRPEIERYLRDHGERFTPEALRRGLLDAGFDAVEVDNALREWRDRQVPGGARAAASRNFWLWAGLIHLAALILVVVVLVIVNGLQALGLALIGAAIMAVVMLVGWGLSGLVGRAVLPHVGPWIALIVPVLSAALIGGTCLGLMGGVPGVAPEPAPLRGSVELQIDPPLRFSGSGPATCFLHPEGSGLTMHAEDLGALEGRTVAASVDVFRPATDPAAPGPVEEEPVTDAAITISLVPSGGNPEAGYQSTGPASLDLEVSADLLSGTVGFESLEPVVFEGPAPDAEGEPISGTITWTCE
jgi:hypothetical protein